MRDTRTYSIYPSDLNILAAVKQFRDYLKENKYKETREGISIYFFLVISSNRELWADTFEEFIKLLEKYPSSLPLTINSSWKKKDVSIFNAHIKVRKSGLEISVESKDLDIISAIHEKLKDCFQASNPHQNQIDRLSIYDLKKSVFLAHRFDDYGNSMASKLKTFLERLGFDVKEGSGYEAKDIPDKVDRKIKSQDIFICLVTPGGTDWIVSEASYAKALNKYLVLICQKGVAFKKGMIGGDYEHLPFPKDNIEKCFSDLVYALPR